MAFSKRVYRSLPFELVEEILKKTPAESLNRFKSTCKQWYGIITDKRFMYNHLDHSPERFIRIDDHKTVQIMDPMTGIFSDSPVPDVFRSPHSFASMVHCDGLMLCGVRKQIETGRHEESRYSNPFICSYVYVPSVIPVPE
ncbi:unnamed protein product [Arabidopsis thaliana]|uniref:(thale cress) hypothetical protein n=1 Tax=Arabidopsis thaliana TaxID=3702 RepID=A0A7G2EW81_ARATH|nr:unnamed protein product [Arabidopsis thaliana]